MTLVTLRLFSTFACARVTLLPTQPLPKSGGIQPQKQVLRDSEVRKQSRLLVYTGNTHFSGPHWVQMVNAFTAVAMHQAFRALS